MPLTNLTPASVWQYFDKIRMIPRCSGNEAEARAYVLKFAKEHGFAAQQDDVGNVVVKVPASPGCENAPTVILQGHLDMVGEKNSDVDHDFDKDPIQVEVVGEWLTAKGTTLGADNGIGVAAGMAAATDAEVTHGPLELLMTVDEETGLTGAGQLATGMLDGKILLNLDSEELGAVFIGCSGGGDSNISLPIEWSDAPANTTQMKVQVAGLRGGHSGLDIHEQRGNAVKTIARVLWEADRKFSLSLVSIDGGNKRNAIPREAGAVVVVGTSDVNGFKAHVAELEKTLADELGGKETEFRLEIVNGNDASARVMSGVSKKKLLNLLMAIPHGVVTMSYDIPGLVETSTNLATVKTENDAALIGCATRSSMKAALQTVRDRIRSIVELADADITQNEQYPGWKPNLDSYVLKVFKDVHKNVFGKEPEVMAIHAGLECGIIGEKYPGTDMISFGPDIENPHSPDERINIPSVDKFWGLLKELLGTLAKA